MTTPPDPLLKVAVAGGKYEVVLEQDGRFHALRYGEEWRDIQGDNLIYALATELAEARADMENRHRE